MKQELRHGAPITARGRVRCAVAISTAEHTAVHLKIKYIWQHGKMKEKETRVRKIELALADIRQSQVR